MRRGGGAVVVALGLTCTLAWLAAGQEALPRLEVARAGDAARGSMVRWCAERGIGRIVDLRSFDVGGYAYDGERSDADTLTFVQR